MSQREREKMCVCVYVGFMVCRWRAKCEHVVGMCESGNGKFCILCVCVCVLQCVYSSVLVVHMQSMHGRIPDYLYVCRAV